MLQSVRKKAADSLRLLTALSAGDGLAPVRILKKVVGEVAERLSPLDIPAPPQPEPVRSAAEAPAPPAAQEKVELEAGELRSEIDAGTDFLIVDVREPGETQNGVIPNARLIPLGKVLERIGEFRDQEKPVVVYCAVGTRSRHAVVNLRDRGVARIYSLRGGIDAWMQNGGEIRVPQNP